MTTRTAMWLEAHPEERALLERFTALMADELAANDGKGNRSSWLQMTRQEAIAEVQWHASKLAVSAKALERGGIDRYSGRGAWDSADFAVEHGPGRALATREYAVDVANCALMALDVLGLISPAPPTPGKESP